MLQVEWVMSNAGTWLNPRTVDWTTVDYHGVYAIWAPGTILGGPIWLRAGQGDVRARVQDHIRDARFSLYPEIRFTYAQVTVWDRDGVERYLGNQLRPKFAERYPEVLPIPVNLPQVA